MRAAQRARPDGAQTPEPSRHGRNVERAEQGPGGLRMFHTLPVLAQSESERSPPLRSKGDSSSAWDAPNSCGLGAKFKVHLDRHCYDRDLMLVMKPSAHSSQSTVSR